MDMYWKCRMSTITIRSSQPISQVTGSCESRAVDVELSHVGEKCTPHPR